MKTYSVSGTLGDCYINLLKLYTQPRDIISLRHYTIHTSFHPLIREVYSLLPNLRVQFVDSRDMDNKRIFSHLNTGEMEHEPFPEFVLPEVEVPDDYYCVQMRSGKEGDSRWINYNEVPKDKELVFVGGDPSGVEEGIDYGSKLTLLESFYAIRESSHFYCPQGALAFFSMSQKVPTTVWLNNMQDLDGFFNRYCDDWKVNIKDWR